jgi:hypothetical protein
MPEMESPQLYDHNDTLMSSENTSDVTAKKEKTQTPGHLR